MYRKQLIIVIVIMAGLSLLAEAVMQEKAVKNDHVLNLSLLVEFQSRDFQRTLICPDSWTWPKKL
jgi:hypothetical protein